MMLLAGIFDFREEQLAGCKRYIFKEQDAHIQASNARSRVYMKFSGFALYCGLLLSISAFSIDILLPSLLAMASGLQASIEHTQLVIPVYMFALGLGNPFYGILSDRRGRRFGIFVGLGIYVAGSVLCLLAASIDWLLIGRFLQGFGAASAPVIGRAMIRDKYSGVGLAQNMAVVSMFFALGPMIAPLLGYGVYSLFGWRTVFLLLICMAIGMIVATWKQKETLQPGVHRNNSFDSFRGDIVAVYRHPQSLYFIVLSCFCTCLILTFLSHAPIVYASFGTSSGRFAVLFAASSVGIVVGQYVNHALIGVLGSLTATVFGAVVIMLAALLTWIFSMTGALNEILFSVLMFFFALSYLIVFSNIVSFILDPHPQRAGTASAMFGFTSYMVGSLLAAAIGFITDENIIRWSGSFLFLSVVITTGAVFYKYRRPVPV